MNISIVFENDCFVAIDKPVGVVVNKAQTVKGETVQEWAEHHISFQHQSTDDPTFTERVGIVHRIDKETSGLLLIAKTSQAFLSLQHAFKEHLIQKTYTAFAHGIVVPEIGQIDAPVGRLPWNREQFGVVPGGKESKTRYHRIDIRSFSPYRNESIIFSVLDVFPETGRTHQIRVHMKYIGHPLIGDYLYAGRKTSRSDREWANRVMLHAKEIIIPSGICSDESITIRAPFPNDMTDVINKSKEKMLS